MDVVLQREKSWHPHTWKIVSILVLMDVVLQLVTPDPIDSLPSSFNPCFNGCCSSTFRFTNQDNVAICFNPCFNGCCSSTPFSEFGFPIGFAVSILVLMDVVLQL